MDGQQNTSGRETVWGTLQERHSHLACLPSVHASSLLFIMPPLPSFLLFSGLFIISVSSISFTLCLFSSLPLSLRFLSVSVACKCLINLSYLLRFNSFVLSFAGPFCFSYFPYLFILFFLWGSSIPVACLPFLPFCTVFSIGSVCTVVTIHALVT